MAWGRRRSAPVLSALAADPAAPVIRLENVSKVFRGDADDEVRALDSVNVSIARGDYVSVSGPSGCGKSTFLNVLGLLDSPTSGRYWLNGRATETLSPGDRARVRNLDVGLIFQSFNLIGDMTVYENVEYPLSLRGVSVSDRKARVEAALGRAGRRGRAQRGGGAAGAGRGGAAGEERGAGRLSGGGRQLVAVGGAITGGPAILLADEPSGN